MGLCGGHVTSRGRWIYQKLFADGGAEGEEAEAAEVQLRTGSIMRPRACSMSASNARSVPMPICVSAPAPQVQLRQDAIKRVLELATRGEAKVGMGALVSMPMLACMCMLVCMCLCACVAAWTISWECVRVWGGVEHIWLRVHVGMREIGKSSRGNEMKSQ